MRLQAGSGKDDRVLGGHWMTFERGGVNGPAIKPGRHKEAGGNE